MHHNILCIHAAVFQDKLNQVKQKISKYNTKWTIIDHSSFFQMNTNLWSSPRICCFRDLPSLPFCLKFLYVIEWSAFMKWETQCKMQCFKSMTSLFQDFIYRFCLMIELCMSHLIMNHDQHHHHHHGLYNDQYQLLHFWHLAASEMHKESDLFPKMHRRTLRYVLKRHLQYRIQDTKENTKCAYHEILLYCTSMLECNQEPMQSYPDQMHSRPSTAKTVQSWHWPNMTCSIFIMTIYILYLLPSVTHSLVCDAAGSHQLHGLMGFTVKWIALSLDRPLAGKCSLRA